MKKISLLIAISVVLFTSCKKESSQDKNSVKGGAPKSAFLNQIYPGEGGTIGLDPITGKYKATYGGAELEFSPVPNNTNFKDGDPVDINIYCTNCSSLIVGSAGYFVASVPLMGTNALDDIHTRITKFNNDYLDFLVQAKDVNGVTKQPVMPSFPNIPQEYASTISGVVVRAHSTSSTIAIMPGTFKVNPPIIGPIDGSLDIGGVVSNNVYYSITINAITKRVIDVSARNLTTNQFIDNISWSGIATSSPTGDKVTLQVIHEGVVLLNVIDQLVE